MILINIKIQQKADGQVSIEVEAPTMIATSQEAKSAHEIFDFVAGLLKKDVNFSREGGVGEPFGRG